MGDGSLDLPFFQGQPAVSSVKKPSFTPLFQKLLEGRGLTDPVQLEKFLNLDLEAFEDPFLMKGMTEAAERVRKAVREGELILVHGDYDVDGVTGTALMVRVLAILEARFSSFLPDRTEDGYGVSERAIRKAAQAGAKLLITVDCGITARKAIELARSLGVEVLIIDHHRVPETGLPNANIILNPQQSDCPYPFKDLSAAGLVFKLAQALLGRRAFQFLDLAALSTVCDVAPLKHENRIIVKKGLELLSDRTNPGIRALSEAANIKARNLNSGHIGFMLGPRINAAGRMSSPEIALRLLMTDNPKEAESLALVLEEENRARQKEERETTQQAISQVERTFNFNRDRVIVAAKEGWHPGVIGIVASRLVERFHRPSVVIALDQGKGKGSGRSIKGFNLFEALNVCKDFFIEFGGHEQAAGLSITEERVADFRALVNQHARERYDGKVFVRQTPVDLEIKFSDFRSLFVHELELLEPHGAGNPRPIFMTRQLEIKSKAEKIYGDTFKFWVSDGVQTYEALWNDRAGEGTVNIKKGRQIHLTYCLKGKVWEGVESLSLDVKEIIPIV
jgi:single-stranded-DNA-specific exonuclease